MTFPWERNQDGEITVGEDLFGNELADDIGLQTQIDEARRELHMRERVYPRWIEAGKIKAKVAENRIAIMKAIVETLEGLRA